MLRCVGHRSECGLAPLGMRDARPLALSGVRLVIAVTAPESALFYEGQLAALRAAGADVSFIASPSAGVEAQCAQEGVSFVPISMERAPAPVSDVRALATITHTLRRLSPDIVVAGTPKAGLLAMVAAHALRVPVRVQTLHGLRYEVAGGATRAALWLAQRLTCAAATHVVCVSESLRAQAIATHVLKAGEGNVIGAGSVNGVNATRFARTIEVLADGRALRDRYGIAPSSLAVGYLGRLAHDKGIHDLAAAWDIVARPDRRLLLAGEVDPTDRPCSRALKHLSLHPGVSFLGALPDPVAFLAAVDLLVLPTYREGFPTVLLEASAMELPVVATRATGCVDAVVDGRTGTLVPVGDAAALAAAMERYFVDPNLRLRHGNAGRRRVLERFTSADVHQRTVEFYARLLASQPS